MSTLVHARVWLFPISGYASLCVCVKVFLSNQCVNAVLTPQTDSIFHFYSHPLCFLLFFFSVHSTFSRTKQSLQEMTVVGQGFFSPSTTLVQAEISQHLLDLLAQNLVQTFVVPRG